MDTFFSMTIFLRAVSSNSNTAIIAPEKELIINGITKANNAAFLPMSNMATGHATIAPIIPVPITSPNAAKYVLVNFLYMRPASNAPNKLPGNANKVPIPRTFLIIEIAKALVTAYIGPSIIAEMTLIKCCHGKHLVAPMGMW